MKHRKVYRKSEIKKDKNIKTKKKNRKIYKKKYLQI